METAAEIAAAVRAGTMSAIDVVEQALDGIAARNGAVNAFCEVRSAGARTAAAALAARIDRGADPGPLAGVPVAIKDMIWEAGVEATDGSRSLLGFVPNESASLVERLVNAGAIVIGRTNLPEFCYRGISANALYGTTSNPWDTGRVPGGSSGGAGAAVAASMVPLAVGSDGGGSIRIPASFCGVVGHKPTYGLVPREAQWPGWWSLTHLGPMSFTVLDAAMMLQAMAGPDDLDPMSLPALGRDYVAAAREPGSLAGLRVAVSVDLGYVRLDDEVRKRFAEAVARFRLLGATIEEAHPELTNPVGLWNTLTMADNMASEGPLLAGGRVGADARSLIEAGATVTGPQYAAARNAQYAYARQWARFMRRYDLLLTPSMECAAFAHGTTGPVTLGGHPIGEAIDDWCHFMNPANLTGQPAISVPMAPGSGGLPLGLHIVGRRFEDDLVLRAAAAWERIAPWERPPLASVTTVPVLEDDREAVAGSRVRAGNGLRVVRRVLSPEDGRRVVEYA